MASCDQPHPELTGDALHLLRDLFAQHSGLFLRDDLTFVAERRLAPRLDMLGLRDFLSYHRYLRFDPRGADELDTAIDLLVPHETYFFREPAQLECFVNEVMPLLQANNAGSRSLRLWSAGCASGEEAYTLAMLALDAPAFDGWALDILGTDVSRAALAQARHAAYGPLGLRTTTPAQRARYFEPAEQGRLRVQMRYRAPVRFEQLNLLDVAGAALLPEADVIFCRNVLMYFDAQTRRKVVDLLYSRLRPRGLLLLGHAEHLLGAGSPFELLQLRGDLVYRKPAR
jgi:chemotaxis protein methyltransferase CheR